MRSPESRRAPFLSKNPQAIIQHMKHRLLTAILCGASALGAMSQGKINPEGMLLLKDMELRKTSAAYADSKHTLASAPIQSAGVLIGLKPGADSDFLSKFGLVPTADIGDGILLVQIPIDLIEQVAACEEVQCMEFGKTLQTHMNYAREDGKVDQVQNGFTHSGKTMKFDGTGVVTGLFDTGLDPNHANFRTSDGTLRVKRFWHYTGDNGVARAYTSPTAIAGFTTDTREETHGTHVAGIMAGSYTGTGTWINQPSASSKSGFTQTTSAIPFKGVAPGSEIAMAGTSMLSDDNIIGGVSKIVEFAESEGKPCVVNISIGSNIGPHDGTDLYSRSLSALGKRAIICLSAGNEGDINLFVSKKLTSSSNKAITFINGNEAKQGWIDIWASNDKTLSVSWIIYDTSTKTTTDILSSTSSSSGKITIVGSTAGAVQNATFNSAFTGSISLASNLSTTNNRYNVSAGINAEPKSSNATKLLGLKIEGEAGQTVYVYGLNVEFTNNRYVSGSLAGSPKGSISDPAAADNVISVGSYNTRLTWATLDGLYGYYPPSYTMGNISSFSSYGKTFQGVQKPDVCAPGCGIVSSISTPYVTAAGSSSSAVGTATAYNRKNYWDNMQGTSMASPYFSGVVALWLQANPSLNYDDIMDVVNSTSIKDMQVIAGGNAEKWGAGKVDALAGIKKILDDKAAIGGIAADDAESSVIITPAGNGYELYVAGADRVKAQLFSISGIQAASIDVPGNRSVLSTESLAPGIYILSVDTPAGKHSAKIMVK